MAFHVDVIGQPINSGINNGSAVVFTPNVSTKIQTVLPQQNNFPAPTGIAVRYDDRFNDPTYYSA